LRNAQPAARVARVVLLTTSEAAMQNRQLVIAVKVTAALLLLVAPCGADERTPMPGAVTFAPCAGCHGSPESPAPPPDLDGNAWTTAVGVGAHQAHLRAPSKLSAPIACTTCHVVPVAVDSPGHLAGPGPAIVNARLGYDHDTQVCTNAYCHGSALPAWTSSGDVTCGTCHGIPPIDAAHDPSMTPTTCVTCHPGTVDATGAIIVIDGSSEHINGVVDLR
jgi:predicted CxxxxCH...CXXCH cytochrome family protein